ncbi:MAG: metal-dependent transcriptional regulator [Flavobacteriales bacterium]|nr:metal-dependent transcriptional regulator [Flavobacteriales bacterium]
MFTRSEEDHLKAIHSLSVTGTKASTSAISERLDTKASSVTDMLKRLAEKGLVAHEPYHGAKLTTSGRKAALVLIRRHRLWETFLVDKLGFRWDEVHEVAEQLEHVSSEKLIDRLDAHLGHPRFDPHGDPIPDKKGRMVARKLMALDTCVVGDRVRLSSVRNSTDVLLHHLTRKGIALGSAITVTAVHDFDGSMELKLGDGRSLSVSREVADQLMVQ